MNKSKHFLLLAAMLFSFPVMKADYYPSRTESDANGLRYSYTVGNSNATIYAYDGKTPSIEVPESFEVGSSKYYVTAIREAAFNTNQTKVNSIDLSNTKITSLPANAFDDLTNLTTVKLPGSLQTIGNYAFKGCSALESIDIPASVTSIGTYAFQNCSKITSVSIPETITTIGAYMFNGCSTLASVTLPENITSIGNNAFDGCSNLEFIVIPEDVTTIGNYAFRNCSTLTSINIPSKVTNFGTTPFSGCTGTLYLNTNADAKLAGSKFSEIFVEEGVTTIPATMFYNLASSPTIHIPSTIVGANVGNNAFRGTKGTLIINCNADLKLKGSLANYANKALFSEIIVGKGVTTIPDNAFNELTSNITLPSTVTSFGDSPFAKCTGTLTVHCNLTVANLNNSSFSAINIIVDEGVTEIPANAYANIKEYNLASITLPSTIQTIGSNAFDGFKGDLIVNCNVGDNWFRQKVNGDYDNPYGTFSFKSVTIGEGVTSLGNGAFQDCKGFNAITLPSTLTTIGAFSLCGTELESVIVPEGVTSLANDVFAYCGSLSSVTLPSTLTSIGVGLFNSCTSLTSIELPDGLTSLPGYTFYNCTSLNSVKLPSGLVSLGQDDFFGCAALTSIKLPSTLKTIGVGAFNGAGLTSIVIPEGVTTLAKDVFYGCTSLTSVTIPSTVQSVGTGIFNGCTALTSLDLKSIPEGFQLPSTVTTASLHFNDNSAVDVNANLSNLTLSSLDYTRSITSSTTWGALVLPFDCESSEDYQLYTLKSVDIENSSICFEEASTISANTPCFFKKLKDTEEIVFSASGSLNADSISPITCETDGWKTYGTYSRTTCENIVFYIKGGEFWFGRNITMKPFRAWFSSESFEPSALSGSFRTVIFEEGMNTGIENLAAVAKKDQVYDLQGRKSVLQSGKISIINGKSILVK